MFRKISLSRYDPGGTGVSPVLTVAVLNIVVWSINCPNPFDVIALFLREFK
jgi:hypothetical protein